MVSSGCAPQIGRSRYMCLVYPECAANIPIEGERKVITHTPTSRPSLALRLILSVCGRMCVLTHTWAQRRCLRVAQQLLVCGRKYILCKRLPTKGYFHVYAHWNRRRDISNSSATICNPNTILRSLFAEHRHIHHVRCPHIHAGFAAARVNRFARLRARILIVLIRIVIGGQ